TATATATTTAATLTAGESDSEVGSDSGTATSGTTGATGDPAVLLHLGDDLDPAIAARVEAHIAAASPLPVVVVPSDETIAAPAPGSLVLSVGDTPSTRALIPAEELAAAGSEAFILRSGSLGGAPLLATDGNPLDPDPRGHSILGVGFGAYALLEHLGFAFLHPLAPTRPVTLPLEPDAVDRTEAPRWPVRGLQLHTMHPLELTDLVNGWGPLGPDDALGWEAMLPEWDAFLEWMLANRQNRVHWVLLTADPWAEFADSQERADRMAELVDRGHAFGVWVGVDVPLALHQQHAWRLIRESGELAEEVAQIHARVDYLMGAGFDYLATESGTTEFTSVDDVTMLAWMDALAAYMDEAHDREALIKIHISSGQTVDNFVDPIKQEPLNFNFLPHYADPRLGVMPHTVQHYALDDPAPTYGNQDFGHMRDFIAWEAGARKTVWHPESAYWVSFDIDVPLFLPVYAHRRLHDLRLLAGDEEAGVLGLDANAGARIDGQITFSSGWEWAYWIGEVVTARAAWDPKLEIADEEAALAASLDPLVRPFGAAAEPTRALLMESMRRQKELLIDGRILGEPPAEIERRSGQAYMQGFEAWDDISELATGLPGDFTMTQPERLGLVEMRNPFHDPPGYSKEVGPLLAEMAEDFTAHAEGFAALRDQVPAEALPLFDDIAASAELLGLRAVQLHGLYDYVDGYFDKPEEWRLMRLNAARDALDLAMEIVAEREEHYRVPADRIAGWRDNPTAYPFTGLWTVRTLYYWWRDEGKAVEIPISPCYLNIINPASIALGEGSLSNTLDVINDVFDKVPGIGSITECLSAPIDEPEWPPPGIRD
ncbi:MAG: hypothetical protein KC486_17665, partial [Myxococcales bacterium]|nr:hypothetical protein [Myxococcales bacterium]